eukprot:gene3698-7357_t
MACQTTIAMISSTFIVNEYGPNTFKWKLISAPLIAVNTAQIIGCFTPFMSDYGQQKILDYTRFTLQTIVRFLTPDDKYCTLNICALIILLVTLWIFDLSKGYATSIDADTNVLVSNITTHTVFTIVIAVLNGRYIRAKLKLTYNIEDNVELVNELQGSLQSAVDILNDLLVYESLEKEDL